MDQDQSAEEQRQFEQVLSRLDALMKRGHVATDAEVSGTPQAALPVPIEDSSPLFEEASPPFETVSLIEQEVPALAPPPEIPVLTEVYEPAADAIPVLQDELEDDADIEQAILDRWLPALQSAMSEIVEEETRRFGEGLRQRLQQQMADALRQHIRALRGQTEI